MARVYCVCLHRFPFLRLLIPLVAGIACGDMLFFRGVQLPLSPVLVASGILLAGMAGLYFLKQFSCRWLFGGCVTLFMLIGGLVWSNYRLGQIPYPFSGKETVYRIRLTDKPEEKERSLLCPGVLLETHDSLSHTPVKRNVLLYFPKDEESAKLGSGDELLVYTSISVPVNSGNPDEFDYARYLLRKGVSGTGYVASGNWRQLPRHSVRSFRERALDCRESLLAMYRRLGFTGDEFAVLSALTVGYKEELSEDIRETYSVSGASHVLALSGLHIGFLYLLLVFSVRWLPAEKVTGKLLRLSVVVIPLWTFAFFTGLSPSVVRSVIMFSLLAVAVALNRNTSPLNTLAVAAFLMLLLQPGWLFDIGFQLSFCAVLSIVLIYPRIFRLVRVKNRILNYTWSLLAVSLAAQVGTVPLVLVCFSRFSTHFLLTNLLVVPLVSLIMYAAVAMLALTPLPLMQEGMAVAVRWLVGLLNNLVRWVEQLPFSSFDQIRISPPEVFIFYIALFLLLGYVVTRRGKGMCAFLACLLLLVGYHLGMSLRDVPRQSIVFYNVRGCPVTHCITAGGQSWLAYADSVPDTVRLVRVAGNYWNHYHLSRPRTVTTDYTDNCFSTKNRIVSFGGKRICQVNDNRWQNKTAMQPLLIDYLYICKGYTGRLEWLTRLFTVKKVVLDASVSEYRKTGFCNECRRLGLPFVVLSNEGSVQFLL